MGGQPRARFGWVDFAQRGDLPGSTFDFVLRGTDVREHVLLFCLLGLVLTATLLLVAAPGAVTWALSLMIG
jgi:hypothetical protein